MTTARFNPAAVSALIVATLLIPLILGVGTSFRPGFTGIGAHNSGAAAVQLTAGLA